MEINVFPLIKVAATIGFCLAAHLASMPLRGYCKLIPWMIVGLIWGTLAVRISSPETAERVTSGYDTPTVFEEPTIELQTKELYTPSDNAETIKEITK